MGHAEHFLLRLERLPPAEVDLALELYRDADLLRAVLTAAAVPEQVERVAISLDDAALGPFLIVTRDGHFVTCLGRGMSAGPWPVVTRVQLDAAGRTIERLREQLALAQRLTTGGERGTARLLRRLFVASESVSREEFLAVAAWEPLLGPVFLELYVAMSRELLQQGPLLRRMRAHGAQADEALHAHWDLLHATGHMALLGAAAREKEGYADLTEGHEKARAAFSWALTGTGVVTFIVKGAWAAGRVGRLLLPEYRRALADDVALFELFDTLFALVAIGCRTAATRAEIRKALRTAPGVARTPEAQRLRAGLGREIEICCELAVSLLETPPEELESSLMALGAAIVGAGAELPDDPRVPDLQRTLPLMTWTDGITDGKKLAQAMFLVAAAARGGPEQFYLPAELARVLHRPWRPEDTWTVLDPMMRVERAGRKPTVAAPKVGRNDPCACGSGRKWKKCCRGGTG
jgi:hypothetical protein